MEQKRISRFQIKQADEGRVIARFATLGVVDLDGDIIAPGAIGEQQVKVSAFGHQSWQGQLPVGRGRTLERGNEALADLQFFTSTTHGSDTFNTIKGLGSLGEWSMGYEVTAEDKPDEKQRAEGVRRVLKRLKIFEVSPVFRGAGVATQTISAKCSGCGVATLPPDRRELERAALRARDARIELEGIGSTKARDLASFTSYCGHLLTGLPGRIAAPDVKLYDPTDRPGADGYMVPGLAVIHAASDLDGEALVRVVLHESAHLRQRDPASWKAKAEAEAERFAAKWSRPVWQAYRWSNGQAHRVRITRNREPPFQGAARDGHVVLQQPAGRAWTYCRRSSAAPWKRIG